MKERPIIFSSPMISPIQRDIKTMTRRMRGLEKINEHPDEWTFDCWYKYTDGSISAFFYHEKGFLLFLFAFFYFIVLLMGVGVALVIEIVLKPGGREK